MTSVLLLALLTVGQTIVDSPLPISIDVPVATSSTTTSGVMVIRTDTAPSAGVVYTGNSPVRYALGMTWYWCDLHRQWTGWQSTATGWQRGAFANASTNWLATPAARAVQYYTAPTYTYTAPTYQGRYGATWTNVAPAQTYNVGNYGRTYNYGNNGNYYPVNRTYGARAAGTCRNCRR